MIASGAALYDAIVQLLADGFDQEVLFTTLLAGTTEQWEKWAEIVGIRTGGKARTQRMRDAIAARAAPLEQAA